MNSKKGTKEKNGSGRYTEVICDRIRSVYGCEGNSVTCKEKDDRTILSFMGVFVCTMEGARTRRRRTAPQAISPVGCCLELRVAAPSIRLVPWVALASCWPLPQQLLLASATGRSRRCCRSQWLGMSTVEAVDRKISWLFCFISHGCTVSARFLHGRCCPCPIM